MSKSAITQVPLHPLLQNRWSPRGFDSRPIEHDKLVSILEAGRWSPSSGNAQPWRFIIATQDKTDDYAKMLACLNESNQEWAKYAPVLMIAVAKTERKPGRPNRHYAHDTGIALGHMVIQAFSLDIYAHMMGGFDGGKARETYQIPDGYEPMTALAFGYLGTTDNLSERNQERESAPRERLPLSDIVFRSTWGNSWD